MRLEPNRPGRRAGTALRGACGKFQRGFLLVTAVVLIIVAALVLSVMVYLSAVGNQSAVHNANAKQALFIAGTGLERGVRTLLSPVLTERLGCGAITGDANLTDFAFGAGRFTVTAGNGGVTYYPATTLKANISATDSIIPVNNLSGYANAGRALIDRETIDYYDVEPSSTAICGGAANTPCLVGAQRGRDGTVAVSHVSGTPVGQYQCDLLSQGGVPDFASARGKRTVQKSVQLQEAWVVGDRANNNFTSVDWNRPTETQWNDASFTDAANRQNLNAVSMLSYADGWAVGDLSGNNFTLMHRTGAGWTAQPLGGNGGNRANLNGISCISMNDCWAVGDRNGNNFTFLRYNGVWSVRQLAGNGGNRANLNAIYCADANNCWAVGDRNGNKLTFVQYLNGIWTARQLAGNNSNRANLNGVYCVTTSDCWAVGDLRINSFTFVKYNGANWTVQQLNDPVNRQNLRSVYCVSTSDCWAVGDSGVVLRGSGSPLAWSVFATPGSVTGQNLHSVACATGNDCWVVGDGALILHWDGSSWTAVAVPGTVTQNLRAVAVIAADQHPWAAWSEIFP